MTNRNGSFNSLADGDGRQYVRDRESARSPTDTIHAGAGISRKQNLQANVDRSHTNGSSSTLGFSAFTTQQRLDSCMPFESSNFDKICFVQSGHGKIQYGDTSLDLSDGDLVRVPADLRHRFVDRPDAPMTICILGVAASAFAAPAVVHGTWRDLAAAMPIQRRIRIPNSYFRTEFRRLFRSIVLELGNNRIGRETAVFALATQLVLFVRRIAEERTEEPCASKVPAAFVSSVTELEERFAEPVNIGDLAESAGMSYRSYTHNFRRYKGMTVKQYVTQLRIDFAKRRMIETSDIICSALDSGFGDLSNFYRIFKRQTGCTPQEFIRDHTSRR